MWAVDDNLISFRAMFAQGNKWAWLYCMGCHRGVPVAFAPFAIRWGMDASAGLLQRNFRCKVCGHKRGMLRIPTNDHDAGPPGWPE